MREWVYKTTQARATYADTHDLAVFDHFLCRTLFKHGRGPDDLREVAKVREVAVGDLIHYYYRTPEGNVRTFGTFRVCEPGASAGVFEPCPGHEPLVQVVETEQNRKMIARLTRGYSHDPRLHAFTGWVLEKLPRAFATPGFLQAKMFPSPITNLWHYPDAALPRARTASPATSNA